MMCEEESATESQEDIPTYIRVASIIRQVKQNGGPSDSVQSEYRLLAH